MYTITGRDFADLVDRKFTDRFAIQDKSMARNDCFTAKTQHIESANFSILHFCSSFTKGLEVKGFRDFNHTSFHFQLQGYSNATISGIDTPLPLGRNEFNVINCIDPVSNYFFPQQQDYAYICLGLNPIHLADLLQDSGAEWAGFIEALLAERPFALFEKPKRFNRQLQSVLQALLAPNIADTLRKGFTQAKVEELIFLTLDHYLSIPVPDRQPSFLSVRDLSLLQDLKYFLDSDYLQTFSLKQLARQVGINEFKLKKGFKQVFGHTVFGYIHYLRMQHSLMLLQESNLSIGEIAGQVGYLSDASFSRAFKIHFGTLPSAYRKWY